MTKILILLFLLTSCQPKSESDKNLPIVNSEPAQDQSLGFDEFEGEKEGCELNDDELQTDVQELSLQGGDTGCDTGVEPDSEL